MPYRNEGVNPVLRVIATALAAAALWLSGSAIATADIESPDTVAVSSEIAAPDFSDTKTSILFAGVGGLALGGVIAYWQSRKRRRGEAPGSDSDDPGRRPSER